MATNFSSDNGNAALQLEDREQAAWMRVGEVILSSSTLGMALKSAIRLRVLDILSLAAEELTPLEIVARMQVEAAGESRPSSGVATQIALDRILRVLASYELLSSSLHYVNVQEGQRAVRKYGLTSAGRYLAGAPSLAPVHIMHQHRAFQHAWEYLEQAILEGGEPFTLAHGKSIFHYAQVEDPEFAVLFNSGMANQSKLFMPYFLRAYNGFLDVNILVDVGGGIGDCIGAIVSKHPHIKGINFDQPHVVASAPSLPGVEHVGGDMFKSVPEGETILIKWVLHNWSDDLCVKILKNCYEALPCAGTAGKVIVVDVVLSEEVQTTSKARLNYGLDLLMFTFFKGGKERTLGEFEAIARTAGFRSVKAVTQVNDFDVIELRKH